MEIIGTVYILGYILMGLVQPIAAICQLLAAKRQSSTYAINLKKYLVGVVVYFLILYFIPSSREFSDFKTFYLFGIPWVLAIFYMRNNYIWKHKRRNIIAYNKMKALEAPHPDRLLLDTLPHKQVRIQHQNNTIRLKEVVLV